MEKIRSSETTPQKYWGSRRDFIAAGAVTLAALALGNCAREYGIPAIVGVRDAMNTL